MTQTPARIVEAIITVLQQDLISKIQDPILRNAVMGASEALKASAFALVDETKPNAPQLRTIWLAYVNKDVADLLENELREQVARIKDQKVRDTVTIAVSPIVDMLRIVTDTVQGDAEQIKDRWVAFAKDTKNQETVVDNLIRPILEAIFKGNTAIIDFIVLQIKILLQQFVSGQLKLKF